MKVTLGLMMCVVLTGCPPPNEPPQAPAATLQATPAMLTSGIAVAIVLDASGSMEGSKLDAMKLVWHQKLAPKLESYHQMHKNLEVVLIKCSGSAEVLVTRRNLDLPNLNEAVNQLQADGGTPLGDCLQMALAELVASDKEEKHVFILSDGQNSGWLTPGAVFSRTAPGILQDVSIHVVGFQTDADNYKEFSDNQCQVVMADNADTLDSTCSAIFMDMLKVEAE